MTSEIQNCGNCRYRDLPHTEDPCKSHCRCKRVGMSKFLFSHWLPVIDEEEKEDDDADQLHP